MEFDSPEENTTNNQLDERQRDRETERDIETEGQRETERETERDRERNEVKNKEPKAYNCVLGEKWTPLVSGMLESSANGITRE